MSTTKRQIKAIKNSKINLVKGASPMEWDEYRRLLRFLERAGWWREAMLFMLGCSTGYRLGDLLSIEWDQLLDRSHLSLREEKTSKRRPVKLTDFVRLKITDYQKHLYDPSKRFYDPKKKRTCLYVFANNRDYSPVSRAYVAARMKKIADGELIADGEVFRLQHSGQFSSHTLRKTFGTRFYDRSPDKTHGIIILQKLFGHSSPSITMEYIGLQAIEFEDAYDMLY